MVCLATYPVCLSPMINSLWPRPIGTRLSTALMPVNIGSLTDMRGMIPGAFVPTRARPEALTGPFNKIFDHYWNIYAITYNIRLTFPSMGFPSASTTLPNISIPTGTSTMAPVLFTMSPSLINLSLPNTTIPTLSGSKLSAIPYNVVDQWLSYTHVHRQTDTHTHRGQADWYFNNQHIYKKF